MWRLLLANLGRKRLRLTLTLASIAVAFVLFALVEAMQHALTGGVELAGQDRLMSMSKVSFIQPLPRSYLERIRAQDGVQAAMSFNWFGGYYKDEHSQIPSYALLGEESLPNIYPEISMDAAQWRNWLTNRTGALVGRALANAMHWKVGDTIPVRSSIYFKKDGSNAWDLRIDGVFDANNSNALYFHYDYFNESLQSDGDTIGFVGLRVKDKNRLNQVASQIDAMFANSSSETKTDTEKAFVQSFANQLGNISAIIAVIVSAVFFTMLLVTANSIGQAVRERTNEIGVMKTLGFSSAQVTWLVLAESLLVTLLGGAIGLLLGSVLVAVVAKAVKQYLPLMTVPTSAYGLALICMVLLGVLSGALPCWQAWQLKITDALRRT